MRYVKPRAVIECVARVNPESEAYLGPDCLCWKLRQVPAISDAIQKLHVQKLQSKPAKGELTSS
jgi:hypothetical protein